MNHTTIGTIFAISMVAALMIGAVSILSPPKALATSLTLGDFSIGNSNGKPSLTGPLGLSVSMDNSTNTSTGTSNTPPAG
jgi:hypothetical protein